MIIYVIKNNQNNKLYIGQTSKSLSTRWHRHTHRSSGCRAIRNAIIKYGIESFSISILQKCSSLEEMNELETCWINALNTLAPHGYNLNTGGEQRIFSQETKAKISKLLKGRKASKEFREACSKRQTGRILPEETKKKMSLASLGKPKSESHRMNISKGRTGIKISEEQKKDIANTLRKPIICNETGQIFESASHASKVLKIGKNNIVHILKGRKPSFKGYSFSYHISKMVDSRD